MSLYKDASLVMIPSAYKDGKLYSIRPTDGSGDFTFSRGSNLAATRVDVNGLIEKGRENLLLQSNQFDTTWAVYITSLTSGQSGYDGSSDAWLIERSGAFGNLFQNLSSSGVRAYSVYAKAGSYDFLALRFRNTSNQYRAAYFDLSTGTLGSVDSNIIKHSIESAGNGWYRCQIAFSDSAINQVMIYPSEVNNGIGNAGTGNIYIQDAQLEAGLVATDYIETGASTAQAGILEDMPRLDYSGGASCPALLLEPQRSNLISNSEYLGSGAWFNNNFTITQNANTSPEGLNNATLVTSNSPTGGVYRLYENSTSAGQAIGTSSVFMKYANNQYAYLSQDDYSGITRYAVFDLINGTNTFVSSGYTATITPYADGWYRCTITGEQNTQAYVQIGLSNSSTAYTGNIANGQSVYFWGVQREYNSSYPTSYIPTYGSSVTRGVDSCVKTSATDLIGQTEGTLFVEFKRIPKGENYQAVITLQGASSAQLIEMYFGTTDALLAAVYNSGAQFQASSGGLTEGTYKAALAYKENDFAFYLNGSQIATDSLGTIPALSTINVGGFTYVSGYPQADGIKQALLFKTRLTNDELASLTTL